MTSSSSLRPRSSQISSMRKAVRTVTQLSGVPAAKSMAASTSAAMVRTVLRKARLGTG